MDAIHLLKNANRILIIGSPGSGKTFFAKRLAQKLNLPLISLDDHYIQKNWERLDKASWKTALNELINKPKWIIEGNYADSLSERLRRSESVIVLESPTLLCFWRVTVRGLRRLLGDRNTLPKSVNLDPAYRPKLSLDIKFIKLVIFFKFFVKPKMIKTLNETGIPKIDLTNKAKILLLKQLDSVRLL